MNTRLAAAAIGITATLALTACGSDGGGTAERAHTKKADAKKGCSKDGLSQADWVELCGPDAVGNGGKAKKPEKAKEHTLGHKEITIGSGGTGQLEITPTTVVYATKATGETPDKNLFAVVTIKGKNPGAVAAAEEAPATGRGWKWITPDGQAIDEGDGNAAYNVVPETFGGGGEIQPGTWAWDTSAFDITEQQRGSTLMYTDGDGATYRWKMPKADDGPQVAQLKRELAN